MKTNREKGALMSGCIGYENKQGKRDYDALDAKSATQRSGNQASDCYKSQASLLSLSS